MAPAEATATASPLAVAETIPEMVVAVEALPPLSTPGALRP